MPNFTYIMLKNSEFFKVLTFVRRQDYDGTNRKIKIDCYGCFQFCLEFS